MSALDWSDYSPREHIVRDLSILTRRDARQEYSRWIAAKQYRIEQLFLLLSNNGIDMDSTDDKIQSLNDWYIANVKAKPGWRYDDKWPLMGVWYSVSDDIASFLGDVMIERRPHLSWQLFIPRSKRNFAYQQFVVAGYISDREGMINTTLCSNPRSTVIAVGHSVIENLGNTVVDRFLHVLRVSQTLDGYPIV